MDNLNNKKMDGFRGQRYIILPTETFKEYSDHPQVKRMILTDVGFFPKAVHHYRERKEGAEEYIFLYCTAGKGIINIGQTEYILNENQAFCIPRLQRHSYYAVEDNPWSILWMHFKGEDTKCYPLDKHDIVKFASPDATNRMLFLFELLFQTLEGQYTLGNFIYIAQVVELILAETYCREKHDFALQNKHVTNIIRYMYRHLSESLTLNQISDEFDLSKSYLHTIFKQYTGRSPLDFFIHLKMKEACKLLRTSDDYIYEVAQRLGYTDQYYFSKVFRKMIGVSPNQYKNG